MTEVVTSYNIDDMFDNPKEYIDDSFDLPIVRVWEDGKVLLTIMFGMNERGDTYLVAEDDDVSEDFYPRPQETMWEVYERVLDDWTLNNRGEQ